MGSSAEVYPAIWSLLGILAFFGFFLVNLAIYLGTLVWVGVDSSNLRIDSPAKWVVLCFFFWLVAFPFYLAERNRHLEPDKRKLSKGMWALWSFSLVVTLGMLTLFGYLIYLASCST